MGRTGESVHVEVIFPAVDDGYVASGLYALSEILGRRDPEAQSHGVLGGEWGYGQDFANDVFEMWPFWWGDCDCGREESEALWCNENPHADTCYQRELERRGAFDYDDLGYGERKGIAPTLAREWGLPEFGCMVHCTCGQQERYAAWLAGNDHDDRCSAARPNFKHLASGLEVRWYKYIGRSMEVSRDLTLREWSGILDDCLRSLEVSHSGREVAEADQ